MVGPFGPGDDTPWVALRVLREELATRLPGATVAAYGPPAAADPRDGGHRVTGLEAWTEETRAALDADLDALVVLLARPRGSPDQHPDQHPDQPSGAGADPGVADLGVSCPSMVVDPADLAALLPAVLDARVVARRAGWLRLMGWCPEEAPLLVDLDGTGEADLAPAMAAMGAELEGRRDVPVVVRAGGAGGEVPPGLPPGRTLWLPEALSVEDVAALRSGAVAVAGFSAGSEAATVAFGRPWVPLEAPGLASALSRALVAGAGAPAGPPPASAVHGQKALALLDRLTSLVGVGEGPEGVAGGRREGGLCAYGGDAGAQAEARRRRRSGAWRLVLADQLGEMVAYQSQLEARLVRVRERASEAWARQEAELGALRAEAGEARRLREALEEAKARLEALESEMAALKETRLYRWSALPRMAYGEMLRRRE